MRKNVFAYWDVSPNASERQALSVALWASSWLDAGWRPRLLLNNGRKSRLKPAPTDPVTTLEDRP